MGRLILKLALLAAAGAALARWLRGRESEEVAAVTPDGLNVPPHAPPSGAVMPDTSADDPLVEEQVSAAEHDAARIGGEPGLVSDLEPGAAADPAGRPVVEGSGDAEETLEVEIEEDRGPGPHARP